MRGDPRIRLPKGWPRTVRSAVIHRISLAQFSLTHTRSWATTTDSHVIRIGGTVSELGGAPQMLDSTAARPQSADTPRDS